MNRASWKNLGLGKQGARATWRISTLVPEIGRETILRSDDDVGRPSTGTLLQRVLGHMDEQPENLRRQVARHLYEVWWDTCACLHME
jgi:hypothetical protein